MNNFANVWVLPDAVAATTDVPYNGKPDRTLSPGGMSEGERRDLIARQRSALYGEGQFVDENGAPRPGVPGLPASSASHRGASPLSYDYGRGSVSVGPEGQSPHETPSQARADGNSSPQSNPPSSLGVFDSAVGQQATRTSNSSPTGGSPPHGVPSGKLNQGGPSVAPIGTRPSSGGQAPNPALNKRSTTPLPSPLSHGFTAASGAQEGAAIPSTAAPSNPPSAAPDGYNGWGGRSGVWGNKSNLGVQASVWG